MAEDRELIIPLAALDMGPLIATVRRVREMWADAHGLRNRERITPGDADAAHLAVARAAAHGPMLPVAKWEDIMPPWPRQHISVEDVDSRFIEVFDAETGEKIHGVLQINLQAGMIRRDVFERGNDGKIKTRLDEKRAVRCVRILPGA